MWVVSVAEVDNLVYMVHNCKKFMQEGAMINSIQFRSVVIKPVVDLMCHPSESAVELLMLTAMAESNLGYFLKQTGALNPALGPFQMEKETFVWLRGRIKSRPGKFFSPPPSIINCEFPEIAYNLRYAAVFARARYLVVPEPLPEADDIMGLAEYWKKHYNSYSGKGDAGIAAKKYTRMISDYD